jgi:SAM-dependent methyltransferase
VTIPSVTSRARTFGSVAAAYERYRPGYPDELLDLVLGYAGAPVATALEVGAGTGKATRLVAARDIAVTATDPDEAMLAELRRHVPETVTVVRAAFEELPPAPYDLVYAAASFHWTVPEGRWPRVASMLRPGGVFASFGGPLHLADPALEAAVHDVRAPFMADDEVPSPDGTAPDSPMQWPGTELEASGLFDDVRQLVVPRRVEMSAAEYVGLLGTISAYLELPADNRQDLFDRLSRMLPERFGLTGDLTLHVARRRTPA